MEKFYSGSESSSGINGKPSAVIATPLHPRRFRQRGFDQAQFIARRVAQRLALPDLSKWVARVRHTTPQTETKTKAERQQNLRCAFEIKDRERLSGHPHV
jgi:predicted amidophosphoribosyltransferase